MTLLIKNGRVLNPSNGQDCVADLLIRDGSIAEISPQISESADREINAAGCFVMPGFIDLHVHLRDPGFE